MGTKKSSDSKRQTKLPPGKIVKSSLLLKVPLKNGKTALFSNISGAIAVVDKELEGTLERFNIPLLAKEVYGKNPITKKAIEQLVLGGMLVRCGVNELSVFEKSMNAARNQGGYGFMFIMTLKCNFRCIYCYEEHKPLEMNQETADKCIEFVLQNIKESKQKKVNVNFYGGEPLLKFGLIKYILENLKKKLPEDILITTFIVTNASLLTSDAAQILKEHNCMFAQITVDGIENIHNRMRPYADGTGSFKDVIKGLRIALNSFPNVALRVNIDKTNINKVPEFLQWLKSNNLQHKNLIIGFGQIRTATEQSGRRGEFCIPEYSWGKEFLRLTKMAKEKGFKTYFELPRLLYCGAYKKNNVIFNPDGTLINCWEGAGTTDDFIIGDVNKDPIYNEKAKIFWDRSPLQFEKCRNCDIISFCGGGCISSAYFENGTFDSVSCPYYKEKFKELVEVYIKDKLEDEGAHCHVDFDKS